MQPMQSVRAIYTHIIPILYHNEMHNDIRECRYHGCRIAARRTVKSLMKQLGLEHPETRDLELSELP